MIYFVHNHATSPMNLASSGTPPSFMLAPSSSSTHTFPPASRHRCRRSVSFISRCVISGLSSSRATSDPPASSMPCPAIVLGSARSTMPANVRRCACSTPPTSAASTRSTPAMNPAEMGETKSRFCVTTEETKIRLPDGWLLLKYVVRAIEERYWVICDKCAFCW
ncbi:hypothetical protein BV25DRAFT_1417140 [Artomyces pyxidatus]|uniref:Uncharacterized protein n=1 Tax=Artomyces pyxidatus TaxID=48021 RepID=A0ACB8TE30_9AGAM|nr:hypothetical protein BV25DRAFT_1417140 [Artomyces pyxidatus]